jgi:hypothetical protein
VLDGTLQITLANAAAETLHAHDSCAIPTSSHATLRSTAGCSLLEVAVA